jgi:thiamine-monophosphate kinase
MQKTTFTTIESIGRKNLISKIAEHFPKHEGNLVFGIGDDAAVVQSISGQKQLLTSELFTEGVDFDFTYMPIHHLGFKLISLAVADIYAMNGKPEFLLVNLGLTNKISVEMTQAFFDGIQKACHFYDIKLIGGDLNAATHAVTVSLTIMGSSENPIYRSGAKEGDAICVTGDLGGAACGLMILLREKKHWESSGDQAMSPELDRFEYVVRRQLVPEARKDFIEAVSEFNLVPNSMIDLSKGLITNLKEVLNASNLGAIIYEAALPVSPDTRYTADDLEEDVDRFVLYGGEEPELLFTLSEEDVKPFADHFKDFVVIGKTLHASEGLKMQTAEGHRMTL